jgi:ribosomal-protein-alanine N-acetyltransferase
MADRPAGWPVVLREGQVTLRPISQRDARAWHLLQRRNREWLQRWEATVPPGGRHTARLTYRQMVRTMRREARAGRMMPFVVLHEDADAPRQVAGQVTVAGITWGSLCGANVGYWIDERLAGRGVIPTAVAMVLDHCFGVLGLHRVELCVRPENAPSRRVAEKLGLRLEGVRPGYLHIDGGWRDHVVYAITAEEVGTGMLDRLRGGLDRSAEQLDRSGQSG